MDLVSCEEFVVVGSAIIRNHDRLICDDFHIVSFLNALVKKNDDDPIILTLISIGNLVKLIEKTSKHKKESRQNQNRKIRKELEYVRLVGFLNKLITNIQSKWPFVFQFINNDDSIDIYNCNEIPGLVIIERNNRMNNSNYLFIHNNIILEYSNECDLY